MEKNHQFHLRESLKIRGIRFNYEDRLLNSELKKLNKKKLRRSRIHSDLREHNFIVKNDKLKAIIDWDDSHEDYIVYEVAIFLIGLTDKRKVHKDKIKIFLKEYQKNMKLNDEEKKAIYYFIKDRLLGVIGWHHFQKKTHKDRLKDLHIGISNFIAFYNAYNKLSLEEFLDLF